VLGKRGRRRAREGVRLEGRLWAAAAAGRGGPRKNELNRGRRGKINLGTQRADRGRTWVAAGGFAARRAGRSGFKEPARDSRSFLPSGLGVAEMAIRQSSYQG
jgi:hypothetical protein